MPDSFHFVLDFIEWVCRNRAERVRGRIRGLFSQRVDTAGKWKLNANAFAYKHLFELFTCVFPLYVQSGLQHAQSTTCSVLFKVVYTHSGCKVGLSALVEV